MPSPSTRRSVRYAGGPPRSPLREPLALAILAVVTALLWAAWLDLVRPERVPESGHETSSPASLSGADLSASDWPPGILTVVFLDVGQGDSAFVRTPLGKTFLIDGGPGAAEYSSFDAGREVVLPFLRSLGIERLDGVVLSHPHEDHLGGLVPVLESLAVGQVVDAGFVYESERYARFLELIRSKGIDYRLARAGDVLDWGEDVFVKVLGPPKQFYQGTRSDPNNNSVVLKLQYGRVRLLFPGDAEVEAETTLARYGPGLRAEILKAPHHGSKYSSIDLFLSQVQPEAAIISAGRNNNFGHPGKSTLRRYRKRGIEIYRTDQDGSITLLSDGQTYRIFRAAR